MTPNWQARILPGPPLIAPARHIVLPQVVAGEEDAMARGALWVEVKPSAGGVFLVQCALGFAGHNVATGLWSTPNPNILLAIAGGYAYRIDTTQPESAQLLHMRPVVSVHHANSLILQGFHSLYILSGHEAWESPRLSWEGIEITSIEAEIVHGKGWHMRSDKELPFTLNLANKELTGGAYLP